MSKRKAKLAWGRIIFYLIASAVVFLLICGIAAGYVFLSAKLPSISLFADEYTVYYGNEAGYKVNDEGKTELKSGSFKKITYEFGAYSEDETLYVNFSALAEYCGFYVSGDDRTLRYIVPSAEGGEDAQFTVTAGSNAIDLNGTTLHLANPVVLSDGTTYMPLEFVERYLQGISLVADENKENVYYLLCSSTSDFYLASSPQTPIDPIDRTALD